MAKAESDSVEEPPQIMAEEYPRTIQVREDGIIWYFAKKQSAHDLDVCELSHIEVRNTEFEPIKRYPWNLPDKIEQAVVDKGYSVIR